MPKPSEIIKFFRNRPRKPIPRGFQCRVRKSSKPNKPKNQREKRSGVLARDPPPPCLPCVRCLPSRSPSARARSRTVLPPSAHRHPSSQPAIPIPRSQPDPPAAPLRDHPPAHTRPPAPALTHAHTHTSTPPRTHPHHTRTLSRHAPGRPHVPTLLRCTHIVVLHRIAVYVEI